MNLLQGHIRTKYFSLEWNLRYNAFCGPRRLFISIGNQRSPNQWWVSLEKKMKGLYKVRPSPKNFTFIDSNRRYYGSSLRTRAIAAYERGSSPQKSDFRRYFLES